MNMNMLCSQLGVFGALQLYDIWRFVWFCVTKAALFQFFIYRVRAPGFLGKWRKNKKALEWPPGFLGKWRKNKKVLEWSKADFFVAQIDFETKII